VKKVGIVGFGHLGSVIAKTLSDVELLIVTRTETKAEKWESEHKNVALGAVGDLASCDTIFLCVRPMSIQEILSALREIDIVTSHLISCAASVPLAFIQSMYTGPVSRAMPNVTVEVQAGVTLLCHGNTVEDANRAKSVELLSAMGEVLEVSESTLDAMLRVSSCGPGLLAQVIDSYVQVACEQANELDEKTIKNTVLTTFSGVLKQLSANEADLMLYIESVATPGGITEAGVEVLKSDLPKVFRKAMERMAERNYAVSEKVCKTP